MPSARRLRLVLIGIVAVVVMTLVYTSQHANDDINGSVFNDFIHRTREGLERAHEGLQNNQMVLDKSKTDTSGKEDGERMAREMRERLKAAEIKAKESANSKVLRPEAPKQVIGVGSSAGGQGGKEKGDKAAAKETDEEHKVETVINDILKKSPGKIHRCTGMPWDAC